MGNTPKNFDAVKMMRDIRTQLHEKYEGHPDKRKQDLNSIRKKYMKRRAERV